MTEKKDNIVLLGFMGSGKTVIGRQTARLLDFDFADTDEEIRAVTGMELSKLFRKYGAVRFRSEERLVVNKLAQRQGLVIACGGSLPLERENLDLLRSRGWCVLLTAAPEVIRSRVSRKSDRWLGGGRLSLDRVAEEAAAWELDYLPWVDFRLDSGSQSVEEAAAALAAAYKSS